MKKTIILLVVILSLLSCSKNDDNPQTESQVTKSWENILGPWKFTKLKRADGSVVDFQPVCAGKRVVIDFTNQPGDKQMTVYFFNSTCVTDDEAVFYNQFLENDTFNAQSLPMLAGAKITSLTENSMEIIVPSGTKTSDSFVGEATGYSLVRFQ
ncbi:hypothetical protein [Flavobacterium urocaniciphilum]|uniref:Lipocalin-like domain-containing protein n=1 Tax=Flavobacterium urocaniciphilum TaxID=1299341 RepID=A0A1H9DIJ5_9FLAO|nr:hypothetical protein [Flavobacterium urocaniciphilum]SEQ13332.1 hypothetical protein SAMN05444005_10768 [Flavobacterium urocaniciphilum]